MPSRDILLQGFHWHSHLGDPGQNGVGARDWWRIVKDKAAEVQQAGFSWVWLPPVSDSLAPQGYIPRRWNDFRSAYGDEGSLRAAIAELGPVGCIADVVLNHRVGVHTAGADFDDPPFPDNHAAIVRDDESGVGAGAPDTGERHPCGRDLDHTNPGVRQAVKEYLRRLMGLGFRGFRYDLVKGFAPRFIAEYDEEVGPAFSVGECFERCRQKVCDWIAGAGGRPRAFDFPLRYTLWEAITSEDYSPLRTFHGGRVVPAGLIGLWPEKAVTFVDNHDTEWTREAEHQANYDATRHFPGTTAEMAYAYILTHPGAPCVFWQHFFDWGSAARERIEALMQARRRGGLTSSSVVEIHEACQGLYAAVVDGRVAVRLGWWGWSPPGAGWGHAVCGDRFDVWVRE
jgi:alpha-amylase